MPDSVGFAAHKVVHVGLGRKILHETLHCAGLRGGACRLRNEGNGNAGLSGKLQKSPFSSQFSAHRAEKMQKSPFSS